MSAIEVKNLECIRRDNILFQEIAFSVTTGELLQIDGINGSGKSTLLRICAGLTQATEGDVYWNGQPIISCRYEFQQAMTYIGHQNGVKNELSAIENLQVMRALSGNDSSFEPDSVLERIGLADMEDVLLEKMSAGQKRRMGLTRLLLNRSTLWLLDEPFTSLDKTGKQVIEKLIVEHCQQGGMVIFATHQAMEIEGQHVRHIHLGSRNDE